MILKRMSLRTYKALEVIGTLSATITLIVVVGGIGYAAFF